MKTYRTWTTLLLVTVLVLVWGVNWPLTKLALADCPPVLFAGLRTTIAGLLLLLPAALLKRNIRWRQTWPVYLTSAAFNIVLYYGLQTIGLRYLPSGLFSTLVFLQPVLVGILSWMFLGERMSIGKGVGFVVGVAGVAVISLRSLSGHVSAVGVLLALSTSIAWSIGTVYVKKVGHRVDQLWLVSLQLIMGGAFMLLVGSTAESWRGIDWSGSFVFLLSFISIFVIAIGWWIFFTLIQGGAASKVASLTFLIPLIAIISGYFLLQERITSTLFVGLACIVASLVLVNRSRD